MKTKKCPTCGAHHGMKDVLGGLPLGPRVRKMLEYLADRNGRFVATPLLLNTLYADEVDGGPEFARESVAVMVNRVRGRLKRAGLDLVSHQGSGYALRWAA